MRRPPLRPFVVLVLAIFAVGATACGDDTATGTDDGRLKVVATTSILGDFAKQVGGERVDVVTVLKPNVDAHDYEPSPADIESLRKADVILRNGVGLETWFDDTIEASGTSATVVDTSDGVPIRDAGEDGEDGAEAGDHHSHGDGHDHGEGDPHIWLDPTNAITMTGTIGRALAAADPDGAAQYEANEAAYAEQLEALDAEISAQVGRLDNKKLVTNHDAFGYYADRYGFEIVGSVIPSFDSSAELSAKDLDALVRAIREEGVRAVFSETSLPGDAARTLADEAGVTVVAGGDALYGDSLGSAGSDASTYLDMMRHNTRTIVANLA